MMETGDPLAGTARNELRTKNSGMLVVNQKKYIQSHYSGTPIPKRSQFSISVICVYII